MDEDISFRKVELTDFDGIFELWNTVPETKRALNPVDDSFEGFSRYVNRNPSTCFVALCNEKIIATILAGHDGRRGIVHHLCVNPEFQRKGIAGTLVKMAETALKNEGIQKAFGLVFKDNDKANSFWQKLGYTARTNLNYRNKSLNENIPQGE